MKMKINKRDKRQKILNYEKAKIGTSNQDERNRHKMPKDYNKKGQKAKKTRGQEDKKPKKTRGQEDKKPKKTRGQKTRDEKTLTDGDKNTTRQNITRGVRTQGQNTTRRQNDKFTKSHTRTLKKNVPEQKRVLTGFEKKTEKREKNNQDVHESSATYISQG